MNANGHRPAVDALDDRCSAFADALPVLDEPTLDPDTAAQARAHLAGCTRCQAHAAAYERLAATLRAHLGPSSATPRSTEQVIADVLRHLPATAVPPHIHTQTLIPLPPPARASAPPPRHSPRFISGVVSLAAILIVALLTAALLASHQRQTPPGNSHVTPAVERGSDTELAAISMDSPTDGWAVGSARPANDTNGSATRVLLMHYTQGAWSRVSVAVVGMLYSVAMVSPTEGWAVGVDLASGQTGGLILHYNGATWTQFPAPTQIVLHQVRMFSANDGFAVGDGGILHFDGQQWTAQSLPASLGDGTTNFVRLTSLALVAPGDAWAVGTSQPIVPFPSPTAGAWATTNVNVYPATPPTALILHYTGGHWAVALRMPGATLSSIAMASAMDGWAAGDTDTYTTPQCGLPHTQPCTQGPPAPVDSIYALLLHYSGGRWVAVSNQMAGEPTQSEALGPIFMLSPTAGWMGRDSESSTLLRFDGSAWNEFTVPSFQATIAFRFTDLAFSSPTSGWAVGYRLSDREHGIPNADGSAFQPTVTPIILRYQDGVWSVVAS